jgi:hypothetical protein
MHFLWTVAKVPVHNMELAVEMMYSVTVMGKLSERAKNNLY